MRKNIFMILMNLLLVVSYSQLSGKHQNLKSSRKLDANLQETILLGFDNYSRIPYDNIVHNSTFYTYFLLKNWKQEKMNNLENEKTEFILDSNVTYMESKNGIDQIKFYCSFNCSESIYKDYENDENFTLVRYFCQSAQMSKDIPKKIRLNSNFTTIKLNGTYVDKVSSTAEAQEKDLVSLKNLTIFGNLDAAILRNATFVNQSPNYFKIRGKYTRYLYDSNNIELITIINGNPTKIQCKGKDEGSKIFIIDFQDGTNSTIIDNNYFKKSSKGLSKGVICAIAIPTILLTLGVGALVFFLSRRPLPPPQPIKNVMNNTVGIASSGVVVNQ